MMSTDGTSKDSPKPQGRLHAHFDCFSGAAGDMMLAACLNAAEQDPVVLLESLAERLRKAVPTIAEEFAVSCRQVRKGSGCIAACQVHVSSVYNHAPAPVPGADSSTSHQHDHSHDHQHSHNHQHSHDHDTAGDKNVTHSYAQEPESIEVGTHSHSHSHQTSDKAHEHADIHQNGDKEEKHHHHHHHGSRKSGPIRNLPEIRRLLSETPSAREHIPPFVRTTAVAAFTELAHAEAHVHGASSIDSVHFHEVGAIDSIVDIVLTCWVLHELLGATTAPTSVSCSPLPLGRGHVHTAHGILPVPAPATLYLLRDMELTPGPPTAWGELVTPTAAALLRVLCRQGKEQHTTIPSKSRLRRIGVGAGTKEFVDHPNILRLMVLEDTAGNSV